MDLVVQLQIIFLLIIGESVISNAKTTENNCIVPIGTKPNYRYQWPLVFKAASGELYPSTVNRELNERQLKVENNIEVILSCGPNYFKKHNFTEVLNVKCNGATGNFAIVSGNENKVGEEMNIKDLTCDLRVIEEVVYPIEGCEKNNLTGVKFGYVDPKEKLSYILGEACYNMSEGRTLFAHVKLGDKVVNCLEKQEENFLTKYDHPEGSYKSELFRGLHFDEIYERIRNELHSKRTPYLKMSNYIDNALLNNAQFQPIRKLSWNYYVGYDELDVLDTLKHDIKKLSEKHVIDIYVGSHGVKELYGENSEKMRLYLHQGTPDRFPMPAMLWFIVKQQEKATAFVVFNEATNSVENLPHGSNICRSDCTKVSWLRQSLKDDVNRDALLCCSYDDLKNSIKEVPIWSNVEGMLL